MSDRYMNDQACGIEPEREGEDPTLAQWREQCRRLWKDRERQYDEIERLREAIERHRNNVWGSEPRAIKHEEDAALYAVLEPKN